MSKITDDYMNNSYKQLYDIELTKELEMHKEYTDQQKNILQKELQNYCNQNSIKTDYSRGKFTPEEITEYIKDIINILPNKKQNMKGSFDSENMKEFIAYKNKGFKVEWPCNNSFSKYKNIPILEKQSAINYESILNKIDQQLITQTQECSVC